MSLFPLIPAIGLLISLAVNIATFFGVDARDRFPHLMILHLAAILCLVPLTIVLLINRAAGPRKFGMDVALQTALPRPLKFLPILLILYAVCTIIANHEDGYPQRQPDASYVVANHGKIIRPITAEEFQRITIHEIQSASAVWIGFFSMYTWFSLAAHRSFKSGKK
jgi:hypothetical protein